jgi:hypothetical protein
VGILLHPWGCDVDDDECCRVRKGILPYFDVEAQLVKQTPGHLQRALQVRFSQIRFDFVNSSCCQVLPMIP